MGGKSALAKGNQGEREVIKALQPTVDKVFTERGLEPPILFRNKNQNHLGGYDIDGLDWLALEVKRQETFQINQWWAQTLKQASPQQVPVLFYRRNRMKWRVMMYGYLYCESDMPCIRTPVDIPLGAFLYYFETNMIQMLGDVGGIANGFK